MSKSKTVNSVGESEVYPVKAQLNTLQDEQAIALGLEKGK